MIRDRVFLSVTLTFMKLKPLIGFGGATQRDVNDRSSCDVLELVSEMGGKNRSDVIYVTMVNRNKMYMSAVPCLLGSEKTDSHVILIGMARPIASLYWRSRSCVARVPVLPLVWVEKNAEPPWIAQPLETYLICLCIDVTRATVQAPFQAFQALWVDSPQVPGRLLALQTPSRLCRNERVRSQEAGRLTMTRRFSQL